MVMEYNYGQMELSMKVFGKMERQQVKGSSYMSMEIFIKETGNKTKLVDMVCTNTIMAHAIKDIGLMTINMVRELKLGRMVAHMLETTEKAKNMAKESIYGKMVVSMMVTGNRIK
jgi:hypothetical protein